VRITEKMAVNLYPRYLWAVLHATFITISLMRPHCNPFEPAD